MKKLFHSTVILIIGVVVFLLGVYLGFLRDEAIDAGGEVEARIVDVVIGEEHDADLMESYDTYTVYADYMFNGKRYSHVMVGKYYEPKYVGDTITVVVDPEQPDTQPAEGGFFAIVGLVMIAGAIVSKRIKKQA